MITGVCLIAWSFFSCRRQNTVERVGQTRVLRSKNVFRSDDQPEMSVNGTASRISDDGKSCYITYLCLGPRIANYLVFVANFSVLFLPRLAPVVAYGSVSMFLSEAEIKDDLKSISSDLAERAKAYYDAQSKF